MNDGWLITKDEQLALWSGSEIVPVSGLPEIRQDRCELARFSAGKEFLLAVQIKKGVGCFYSGDAITWRQMGFIENIDLKNEQFHLHPAAGSITYLKRGQLVSLEPARQRIIGLPDFEVLHVSPTKSGEWIAVGYDKSKTTPALNERARAWIGNSTGDKWEEYPLETSRVQRLVTKHMFPVDTLRGVDAYEFPRLFVGDPGSLDNTFDRESLLIESEDGGYRVARPALANIYGFGRDCCGKPFCTTMFGEYMTWTERRLKRLGWDNAISRFVAKANLPRNMTFLDTWNGVVRGMCLPAGRSNDTGPLAIGSDNWGGTWFFAGEQGDPGGGWKVISPFVRKV
jgi:hypothetical protein